jgi:hypothetical protein
VTAGPPFETYPTTPCVINSESQGIASQAAQIEGVAAQVQSAHQPALLGTLGSMRPPMAASPTAVVTLSQQLAQAAVFAAGALELFATAVEKYDSGIGKLNERWAHAEATNFGVVPRLLPSDATPKDFRESRAAFEAAVCAARERLRLELRAEQGELEDALDAAAKRTAGMLSRGPNAADLKAIDADGGFAALVTSLPFSMARGFLFSAADYYATKVFENASRIGEYTTLVRNRQIRMPVVDYATQARASRAIKVLKGLGNAFGWATGITSQHNKDLKDHPDMEFSERVGRDLTQGVTTIVPAGRVAKWATRAPVIGPVLGGTAAGTAIDRLNDSLVDAGGDVFREVNEFERGYSLTQPQSPLKDLICEGQQTTLDCLEDIVPESWK